MIYSALIPVKSLANVKSRLANVLSMNERKELVLTMLHHVIMVLRQNNFEYIYVVSPDTHVLEKSREWGATALTEKAKGHNAALTAAAKQINTGGLLTISADIPFLQSEDIAYMLAKAEKYDVILAAAHDNGTNAILVKPSLRIPYSFGTNSLQKYTNICRQQLIQFYVCQRAGLAFDIDTQSDLQIYKSTIEKTKQINNQRI